MSKYLNSTSFLAVCWLPALKIHSKFHQVCLEGTHGVTAGPDVIQSLLSHPSTESNVKQFINNWKRSYGEASDSLLNTR